MWNGNHLSLCVCVCVCVCVRVCLGSSAVSHLMTRPNRQGDSSSLRGGNHFLQSHLHLSVFIISLNLSISPRQTRRGSTDLQASRSWRPRWRRYLLLTALRRTQVSEIFLWPSWFGVVCPNCDRSHDHLKLEIRIKMFQHVRHPLVSIQSLFNKVYCSTVKYNIPSTVLHIIVTVFDKHISGIIAKKKKKKRIYCQCTNISWPLLVILFVRAS